MNIGYGKKLICTRMVMTILFVSMSVLIKAQTISVTRFYLAESDLTAQNKKTVVKDQNGDKCALIRIQTTQKGFTFDVGSAGIQKADDNHVGEIWLYVPYGIRHISIRHPLLGSLSNYDFPISIQKARTYIMEITSDKVFINNYDDTKKQKLKINVFPANSSFTLNGMKVNLNYKGEAEQELSFGTYTYKVEAAGYFPKEGQIEINDSVKKQTLSINDLKPILGKLVVYTNPYNAKISIDGQTIGQITDLKPYELQIGKHRVLIKYDGYKTEERIVDIDEDKTTKLSVTLEQTAIYKIVSQPKGALITIGKEKIGVTPCFKELTSGTYSVKATKSGYKNFNKKLSLNSSNPEIQITLKKIYNNPNELYAEGNVRAGAFMAFGATLGGYISNVNIEASYLYGTENSETIYWSGNETYPIASHYTPTMSIGGKVGYGIAVGTRFRITPQIGANVLKLKETMLDNFSHKLIDGANISSAFVSLKISAVIANHFAISLSPEYSFKVAESDGYKTLSAVSPKIKKWGNGFNIKLGLTAFFLR